MSKQASCKRGLGVRHASNLQLLLRSCQIVR